MLAAGPCALQVHAAQVQNTKKFTTQGLLFDLKHPDVERRREAARILWMRKAPEAFEALMAATEDKDSEVRRLCLAALDEVRDARAVPVYVRLTNDASDEIRRKAIDALVHVYALDERGFIAGTKKVFRAINPFDDGYNELVTEPGTMYGEGVIAALEARLEDKEPAVRRAAVMSLGIFRSTASLPRLSEMLKREPLDSIKLEYVRSFYKIGQKDACESVCSLLQYPDKAVHDEAILTAGRLRCSAAVDTLMEVYQSGIKERKTVLGIIPASSRDDLQLKCLQALAMIGDPKAEKLYLPALSHEKEDFRVAAADGLAYLADPKNLEAVQNQMGKAKGSSFQVALAHALYRMGQKQQLGRLVEELKGSGADQVTAYFMALPKDQVAELHPMLLTSRGKARIRLLEILGMAGGSDSLAPVERFTSDSDSDVASAALLAARRIKARNSQ